VIGIDGSRLSVAEPTGTETYTAQLLAALGRLAPPEAIRVYLSTDDPPPSLPAGFETVRMPFPRFWTHGRLSWEMVRRPPDLLFVPAHVVPLRHPPTVVTIHDLGYLHEPESHPPGQRAHLVASTRWGVRVARRVIAVSEATKRDLVKRLGVAEDRVRVVHHGVDPAFRPLSPEAVTAVRTRYGLPPAFVLAVGTIQPRKNVGALARAMRTVAAADLPHYLVIAGKRGWLAERVEEEIAASGMGERVRWLGYVAAGDLPALYNAADAFCFPSRYEGFGMPALEAMACGVPTLLANRAALPEVAGDAALLGNPDDAEGFGAELVRLLTDEELRRRLAAVGRMRAARFDWDRSTAETLAVLREVVVESKDCSRSRRRSR
jgi:glycosyltransferase involved in cell wall biosynthesis